MSQKSFDRRPVTNSWHDLCKILAFFGVENRDNKLFLNWDQVERSQFEFLANLFNKLTNTKIRGTYDGYKKNWVVRV